MMASGWICVLILVMFSPPVFSNFLERLLFGKESDMKAMEIPEGVESEVELEPSLDTDYSLESVKVDLSLDDLLFLEDILSGKRQATCNHFLCTAIAATAYTKMGNSGTYSVYSHAIFSDGTCYCCSTSCVCSKRFDSGTKCTNPNSMLQEVGIPPLTKIVQSTYQTSRHNFYVSSVHLDGEILF